MEHLLLGDANEGSEAVSDALTLAVLVNTDTDKTRKTKTRTSRVRIINERLLTACNAKVWNLSHTRSRTYTFAFDYVVSDGVKLAADVASELAVALCTQKRNCTLLTLESRGFSGTERVLLTTNKGGVLLSVFERLFTLCASTALVFRLLNVCEEHARIDDMYGQRGQR